MTSTRLSFYPPCPIERASVDEEHDGENCPGNCQHHQLMQPWMALSWGEIDAIEHAAALAAETSTDRQRRLIEAEGEKIARGLRKEERVRSQYADRVKDRASMGQKKGQGLKKIQQPCKWVIGQYTGDECWAFEYTNPKTGVRERPHTCERLHPGEQGWCPEWLKNPRYEPAGRFDGLKAAPKGRF